MNHSPASQRPHRSSSLTIGATGGVVGGLLGGGSGVLFVPALDRFTTLSRARIHGTSTVANIAVCAVGASVYALLGGKIDLHAGLGMILGGVVGGFYGARLLTRVPDTLLRVLVSAVLLATAAKLYLDAAGLDPLAGRTVLSPSLITTPWFTMPITLVAGVVIGAWAGALGLGGGLLAVPCLVLLFGTEFHTAEGTSLLMFLPNSIAGGITHLRQDTAAPRRSTLLGLGAIPGTIAGALLALALNSLVLGLIFGTFTLTMGIREILQLIQRPTPAPTATSSPHHTAGDDAQTNDT